MYIMCLSSLVCFIKCLHVFICRFVSCVCHLLLNDNAILCYTIICDHNALLASPIIMGLANSALWMADSTDHAESVGRINKYNYISYFISDFNMSYCEHCLVHASQYTR